VILVRFVCRARIGRSGDLVAGFRRSGEVAREIAGSHVRGRLFTDLSGPFDTVVQELEVESLAEWERLRTVLFSDPQFREVDAAMPDIIASGRTEFYTMETAWP
jgi:hypothetical protein